MTMKHYRGTDGLVYGYAEDGSQDHVIPDTHVPITEQEAQAIVDAQVEAKFAQEDYYRKRLYSYPEIGEFLDAWVKQDEAALEQYRQKCLAIKEQFPKPPGF